jgi:LPLT family lysophospholipid transporter-like MFS transporter
VVGIGAAAYAPAKYGLVTELVGPRELVAANGWIEVTTVCAVLLGTVLGGVLVSPALAQLATAWTPGWPALSLALVLLLSLYGLAAVLNLWVPDSGARTPVPACTRARCGALTGAPTGACGPTPKAAFRWP